MKKKLLVAVVFMMVGSQVVAATREEMCESVSGLMEASAKARDRGVSFKQLSKVIDDMDVDREMRSQTRSAVHALYENPNISPRMAKAAMMDICMKKASR